MSTLFVVATPIGNLSDISQRGVDVLKSVDLIACEDTRHTRILLDRYAIQTQTVSYHQHSTLSKIDWLLQQLIEHKDIALVTDAGTPGISDPGGILVDKMHEYNRSARSPIDIVSIPGPSSLVAALSVCGFPSDKFLFLGFLPKKKGRQTLLKSLTTLAHASDVETFVFFESPMRINRTLHDVVAVLPETTEVCLCRELTKKFETVWRGTISEAIEKTTDPQKGEFVVVLKIKD